MLFVSSRKSDSYRENRSIATPNGPGQMIPLRVLFPPFLLAVPEMNSKKSLRGEVGGRKAQQAAQMATLALEELRREARKLESTIDIKLVSYSKFGANLAHASFLREDDRALSAEAEGASLLSNSEHLSNSMATEIEHLLLQVRAGKILLL